MFLLPKVFITNGCLSDVVVVVAITDLNAKKKAHGISLFLVEAGMPGFTKGKPLEKVGQKSVVSQNLFDSSYYLLLLFFTPFFFVKQGIPISILKNKAKISLRIWVLFGQWIGLGANVLSVKPCILVYLYAGNHILPAFMWYFLIPFKIRDFCRKIACIRGEIHPKHKSVTILIENTITMLYPSLFSYSHKGYL